MRRGSLVALVLALLPETAAACASCISSAYGDRSYNLAYLGLLLTPFALAATVGGVLGYLRLRRRPMIDRPAPGSRSTTFEETT